jgi:hypothetical protein
VVTGHEVRRNGTLIATLPADATSYEDQPTERENSYPVLALPATLFSRLACDTPCIETNYFSVPIRINMGGSETVDSHGNVWMGDGPRRIRPPFYGAPY